MVLLENNRRELFGLVNILLGGFGGIAGYLIVLCAENINVPQRERGVLKVLALT
jgi:hypothetical protein